MNSPRSSDHFSEIVLLGIIAIGVIVLAGLAIHNESAGEASAWTAVLMAIIGAIKERWTQRSVDRLGEMVGQSQPPGEPPPQSAVAGAQQVADAGAEKAEQIAAQAKD